MLGSVMSRLTAVLCALTFWLVSPVSLAQGPAGGPRSGSETLADSYELTPLPVVFDKPVDLVAMSGESDRVLVVELGGLVVAVTGAGRDPVPFLNLVTRVTALQGEQGLFSVAIEPSTVGERFGRPRFVFAAYTERGSDDLLVSRFPLEEVSQTATSTEEAVILRIAMPEPFHHGGQLAFGHDGMLYVGVGNGESSNHFLHERPWSSPSLASLRGKVLRLDVSGGWEAPKGYFVPSDNPYVTTPGARPEIFASGFRNPWKFSFDRVSGALYLADVGNDRYEEINIVTAGGDYGWPSREGPECQALPDAPGLVDPDCDNKTFAAPLIGYPHLAIDPAGGQAVTGGVVSRDPGLPELLGAYIYGDFVVGRIWALLPGAQTPVELLSATPGITALAHGPADELLVAVISGTVARMVPRSAAGSGASP